MFVDGDHDLFVEGDGADHHVAGAGDLGAELT